VRADALDVSLRDGSHSQLVESASEESGEGRGERNGATAATASDGNADHVLLGDETLDESLWKFFLELVSKSRVLGVTVQGDDAVVSVTQLGQSGAVSQTSCN